MSSFRKHASGEYGTVESPPLESGTGALRAIELVLGGVVGGPKGRLAEAAAGLPTRCGLDELGHQLSHVRGLTVRSATLSPDEILSAASAGAALLVEARAGWAVVVRGPVRRPTLVTLRPEGERSRLATKARLARALGAESARALVLESRFGLEPLRSSEERPLSAWGRLRGLIALEATDLVVLAIYAVVLGGLSLAVPVAVQVLVNTIALGSLMQPLVVLSTLLFGVLGFSGAVYLLQAYAVEIAQRRIFVRVSEDFARRLPNISPDAHDEIYAPELTHRFFEIVGIQKALSRLAVDGLSLLLQTLVGMLLLAFYHPALLAFDAALLIAAMVVVAIGYGGTNTAIEESEAKYGVARWLQQVAAQPSLFGNDSGNVMAAVKADAFTRDYLSARRRHYNALLRQKIGGVALQVIAMVGLLGLGGWLVMQGELTLGQLVAAELVVSVIGAGFAKSGKYFESSYDLLASLDKLGGVLDQPSAQDDPIARPVRTALAVELRRVCVGRRGQPINDEVSVHIDPGARVALRGDGGSGKSTFLEVLAGLREPCSGEIRLQAESGPAVRPRDARPSVCFVRPDHVFEGSVLDNLRVGDLDLDEESAWARLEAVHLRDEVAALPNGLHTRLDPYGHPLSNSEVARLCLARAFAAQPKLILLDETLDHLGLEGEPLEEVLNSVFCPERTWTVVVVGTSEVAMAHCEQHLWLDRAPHQEAA